MRLRARLGWKIDRVGQVLHLGGLAPGVAQRLVQITAELRAHDAPVVRAREELSARRDRLHGERGERAVVARGREAARLRGREARRIQKHEVEALLWPEPREVRERVGLDGFVAASG